MPSPAPATTAASTCCAATAGRASARCRGATNPTRASCAASARWRGRPRPSARTTSTRVASTCSRTAIPGRPPSSASTEPGVTRADSRLAAARSGGAARLRASAARLRLSALPIVQCALGAGLAWWIAHDLLGHITPFFAPTAAVISIGVSFGAKIRRSAALVVRVAFGVGIGDLFRSAVGSGVWQITLVVAVAMALAVFVDGGSIISIQAAGSAVLVATLMPPGSDASFDRMIDALVGGLVGVLVVAAIPVHPVRRARDHAGNVLKVVQEALAAGADGLLEQDAAKISEALRAVRGTQPTIDSLRSSLEGGK